MINNFKKVNIFYKRSRYEKKNYFYISYLFVRIYNEYLCILKGEIELLNGNSYEDKLLRNNCYYYTVRHENEENYRKNISEREAQSERDYEEAIRDFLSFTAGIPSWALGGAVGVALHFYYSPYDIAGIYYITKSTCKRIHHDRKTGEERVVAVGCGFEITHNGNTESRDLWC